jgi:hypothetical protein
VTIDQGAPGQGDWRRGEEDGNAMHAAARSPRPQSGCPQSMVNDWEGGKGGGQVSS